MENHSNYKINRFTFPSRPGPPGIIIWSSEESSPAGVFAVNGETTESMEALIAGPATRTAGGIVRIGPGAICSVHDDSSGVGSEEFSLTPATLAELWDISEVWPWLEGSYQINENKPRDPRTGGYIN